MSRGDRRNAELSRAALVVAAGGALLAITQRTPDLSFGFAGKALLVVAGLLIAAGLIAALRTFLGRSGGADQ